MPPPVPKALLVGHTLAAVEQNLILATLDYCRGNRTHAAEMLGISIRTLRNKINRYAAAGVAVPLPGCNVVSLHGRACPPG
jgi:DNA-binding NtrC family response regulator